MNPAQRWVLIVACVVSALLLLLMNGEPGSNTRWVTWTAELGIEDIRRGAELLHSERVKWHLVLADMVCVWAVTGAAYLFLGGEPGGVKRGWNRLDRALFNLPDDEKTGDDQDDEQRR